MNNRYTHLSGEERAVIQVSLEQGVRVRAIARTLERGPSTISRELARNGWHNPAHEPIRRGRPRIAGGYRAAKAQRRARRVARTPRRQRKLVPGTWRWNRVVALLKAGHAPAQVSAMLNRMVPDDAHAQISHETIYTALYALPRGAIRREVISYLRQGYKRRRRRSRGTDRRSQIPNKTSIHVRPPAIDDRTVPGHWERDLIKGAANASAMGTLVERTTLFVSLAQVDNASTDMAVAGFSHVLNRIDSQLRRSLTYDQGNEMAKHDQLAHNTGVAVYFADPHSPWQRGINENTNGLLRQYLPKQADLSIYSQDELDQIAWRLNTRPRKSLGWKCLAGLFMPEEFDMRAHYEKLVALGP